MQTSVYEIEKHTERKRYVVFLNAEYLLSPQKNIAECVVVNINPGGACIMFPPKAVLEKGASFSLKIKNRRLEMIIVTGNIVWFKRIETACIAGVKFSTPLDINSYKKTLL